MSLITYTIEYMFIWTVHLRAAVICSFIGISLLSLGSISYSNLRLINAATPTVPTGKVWTLVFSDEFNGTSLDTSKWITCYDDYYNTTYDGCTNSGNSERQWYKSANVSVSGGTAKLQAQAETVTGWNWVGGWAQSYNYTSGMLSTGHTVGSTTNKQTMEYGYYEARVKLPTGQGLWPAFWLRDETDNSWPPEIDILEVRGQNPTSMVTNYFWGSCCSPPNIPIAYTVANMSTEFHTIGLNWQAGKLDWYFDDVLVRSVASANVTSQQLELVLNLAVGGSFPGNIDGSTPFPSIMEIDYVRVYGLQDPPLTPTPSPTSPPPTPTSTPTTVTTTTSGSSPTQTSPTPSSDSGDVTIIEDSVLNPPTGSMPVEEFDSQQSPKSSTDQQSGLEQKPHASYANKLAFSLAVVSVGSLCIGLTLIYSMRHVIHVRGINFMHGHSHKPTIITPR